MNYQVGDLLCTAFIHKRDDLYIIMAIPEEGVYVVCCMTTYKCYGYNKEGIDSLFRKVA